MSAYMVDKTHIDLLVDVALRGPRGRAVGPGQWYGPYADFGEGRHAIHEEDADRLGQLLVSENLRSIAYRYPDTLEGGDIPGPVDEYYVFPYHFQRQNYRLTAVEALKAISCYEYQACEHLEWEASAAHRFCRHLESSLIGCLDGYDQAPWGWSANAIAERRVAV